MRSLSMVLRVRGAFVLCTLAACNVNGNDGACVFDNECRGDDICEDGECIERDLDDGDGEGEGEGEGEGGGEGEGESAALASQETSIDDDTITTCSAGCATIGLGCADGCTFGGTYASYGNFDFDTGFVDVVSTVEDPSCDVVVPTQASVDGQSYPRAGFACCCQVPEVTIFPGDPQARPACDAVCATAGFAACADFHDWQNGGANGAPLGGIMMRYVRADTGSSYYLVSSCAHLPALTINAAGAERDLETYDCACVR